MKGSEFDEYGNYKSWWTNSSRHNFDEKGKCIVDYYNEAESNYHPEYNPIRKNLGEQTLGGFLNLFYKKIKLTYLSLKKILLIWVV